MIQMMIWIEMMRNELEILIDGRLRYLFWMGIVFNDGVSDCKYTGLEVRDGSPLTL